MENVDWNKIYLPLVAFADQLLKRYYWFRGKGTESYLAGRLPEDYAMDAIERYLTEPEKFDPSRNDSLLKYLKFNLLRRAISNDNDLLENKVSQPLIMQNSDEDSGELVEKIAYYVENSIEDEIDLKSLITDLEKLITEDPVLVKIFEGVCRMKSKRREVIKDYNLSPREYDNGFKRLKTILKKVSLNYSLIKEK